MKNRVFAAGFWSLFSYVGVIALRFVSNIVIAHLVAPEAFGVMTIASTILIGLALLSDVGLRQSVVRNPSQSNALFLNTVWVIQIGRGLLLGTIAALLGMALGIAQVFWKLTGVYADPQLPFVSAVLGLTLAIGGLASTRGMEASRDLRLGRVAQMELLSQLGSFGVMLAWAFLDPSIWALVAGGFGAVCVRVVLSYLWLSGTPNALQWDRKIAGEIVRFGRWIFLSSLLGFFAANTDRLILGGLIDARLFGIYAIAILLYVAIEQLLNKVVADVVFPALSALVREKPDRVEHNYWRLYSVVAVAAYCTAGVLIAAAPAIVALIYDQRYHDAGWMLSILAAGLLALPSQVPVQLFMAQGNPKVHSEMLVVRLIASVVFIPLGFAVAQLQGALGGVVAAGLLSGIIAQARMRRANFASVPREILLLGALPLGYAIGMGAAWLANVLAGLIRTV